jgi:C-terminal processing protease CtpA/Prc
MHCTIIDNKVFSRSLKRILPAIKNPGAVLFFISLALNSAASDSTIIKKYSPAEIKEDLASTVQMLEAVHPNLYHSISKEQFLKKYDSIVNTINDSMTVITAWPKFAFLLGAIDEGHTTAILPKEILKPDVMCMPVLFKDYIDGAFIVRFHASDTPQLEPGDKVISINGEASEAIMDRFLPFFGGLLPWRQLRITSSLQYLLAINGSPGSYNLKFVSNGREKQILLNAAPKASIDNWQIAAHRKASQFEPYQFSILQGRIAYLDFKSMIDYNRFSQFIDSVFSVIKQTTVKGLIIDLRQNGGGNSALGDKLLQSITDKKYRMSAGFKWKISQIRKDQYKASDEANQFMRNSGPGKEYLKGKNGTVIERNFDERTPLHSADEFNGKVCFLIGPGTFSSANMLANAAGDYKLAYLIGEPTGEAPNHYGEVLTLKLSHTGIAFFTSSKQHIRANGDAADPNPVLPDLLVRDDPSTQMDEQLEAAKKWILTGK